MDQNLLNFWKNYEDVINWGYRVSGAREVDGSRSSSPINTQTNVGMLHFKLFFLIEEIKYANLNEK